MKNPTAYRAIVFLMFALTGCKHELPTHTIALLDISASIYPEEVEREFAEMQKIAASMKRGDELTLIPITGNARNETPGRIVSLTAPTTRTPYDSDLVAFRKHAESEIGLLKSWSKQNPGRRTDILGALRLSQNYMPSETAGVELILASDLLEDESEYRFTDDSSLRTPEDAKCLGISIRRQLPAGNFSRFSLLRLRSRDAVRLSPERLRAVDTFWETLLHPK